MPGATDQQQPTAVPTSTRGGAVPRSRSVLARAAIALLALVPALAIGAAHWSRPPWALDRGALSTTEAARFPSNGRRMVLVADFADASVARDAFVAAQADRPAAAALALFGQSLLTAVPFGDRAAAAWASKAGAQAAEVRSGRGATFAVSCAAAAPEVAAALAAEAGDFFALPAALRLVPPWTSPDRRPAGDRVHHQRARQTYRDAAAPVLVNAAAELGVLPAAPVASGPDPTLQFASAGRARSDGRRVHVEGVRFDDLFRGPAGLVAWLRANGCADPRYRFSPG